MINKKIEDINEDDLQLLIKNETLESKTIEYKQLLPQDKEKILEAVSSFANASGGDLIYGISEDRETGKPKSLEGLELENVENEILNLENIIRDKIKPRILPSLTIKPIPLRNSKTALLLRIPKSINSPHGVYCSSDKHGKFYSRSSNGKHPMDISELRIGFNLSETIIENIRHFNIERANNILINNTPVPFYDTAKISLHLIPIASFNPAQFYDISAISSHNEKMPPINSSGWNHRYNLDGFLTFSMDDKQKSYSYVQLYKSGIIEAVNSSLLQPNGKKLYMSYEKELVESFQVYLSILKEINVDLPIFIFLDLLGVKGYAMAVDPARFVRSEIYTIDRDILLLPEIIVENYDVNTPQLLKPCFDSIWNACGFKSSFNYNECGEWAPR